MDAVQLTINRIDVPVREHQTGKLCLYAIVLAEPELTDACISLLRRYGYNAPNARYNEKEVLYFNPLNKRRPVTYSTRSELLDYAMKGSVLAQIDLARQWRSLVQILESAL